MKYNLSYYRHEVDSHNHWKFKTLRRKYGWAGEGKFWALNNIIADSENCILELSDEVKMFSAAADLDFEVEEFKEYLQYLFEKCKLIRMEGYSITTKITQENLGEVAHKRERQREWKKNKSTAKEEKSTSTPDKSTVEKQQSKGNKRKGKESIYIPPSAENMKAHLEQVKEFYKDQVNEYKDQELIEQYRAMLNHLFGKNEAKKIYTNILSMQLQVTYPEFKAMERTSLKTGISSEEMFDEMENCVGLPYKNFSVAGTAMNWMRRNHKRNNKAA